MAGDELMKNVFGISRKVVGLVAVIMVFVGFNIWLMRQVEHTVGKGYVVKRPAAAVRVAPTIARVPVIDRQNDLLMPVAKRPPQTDPKRTPRQNTEAREYVAPRTGAVLTD